MKSVLISIQPKWVEKIASGEKTIEVRKSYPKLETPFKCYIYATKPKKWFRFSSWGYASDESLWLSNGKVKMCNGFEFWADDKEYEPLCCKVIGEFICDRIDEFHEWELSPSKRFYEEEKTRLDLFLKESCLTYEEVCEYRKNLPSIKPLYGWYISELKIYDKPKELSEFKYHCKYEYDDDFKHCYDCDYHYYSNTPSSGIEEWCTCDGLKTLTRPPQSWCYVEDIGD